MQAVKKCLKEKTCFRHVFFDCKKLIGQRERASKRPPEREKQRLRGGSSEIRTQQERNRRERGKVSGRRVRREESYRKGEAGEENGSIGRAAGTEGEGG